MNSSSSHGGEAPCTEKDRSKDIAPVALNLEDPSAICARTLSNICNRDLFCAAEIETEQMSSTKHDLFKNKTQIISSDDVDCKGLEYTRSEGSLVYTDLAAIPPGTDCLHRFLINIRHALC